MGKHLRLSRGQVAMYLSLADGHRTRAAELAGVSRRTFLRAMQHYRVRWPRSDAKLRPREVEWARNVCSLGLSPQRAADQLGVHENTVRKALRMDTWLSVR